MDKFDLTLQGKQICSSMQLEQFHSMRSHLTYHNMSSRSMRGAFGHKEGSRMRCPYVVIALISEALIIIIFLPGVCLPTVGKMAPKFELEKDEDSAAAEQEYNKYYEWLEPHQQRCTAFRCRQRQRQGEDCNERSACET